MVPNIGRDQVLLKDEVQGIDDIRINLVWKGVSKDTRKLMHKRECLPLWRSLHILSPARHQWECLFLTFAD